MKGIVGRKLGMTQVFDPESGVVTPVTVIEAPPCPVVQVKTVETDGYEAVQIAYEAVAARKITSRSSAISRRAVSRGRIATSSSSAAATGSRSASPSPSRRSRPARRSRSPGSGSARASRARSSATTSSAARRATARTTSAQPGSIGASATPSRVFKGMKMAGRMGGKRVTQVGLVVHAVDVEQNLLLVKGSVPGPKNGFVEVREVTR